MVVIAVDTRRVGNQNLVHLNGGRIATEKETLDWILEAESRGGLSDGNQLWDVVPTLDGLGPAGDHDHCSERSDDGLKLPEYVDRTSFVPKAALNVRALEQLLA